MAAARGHHASGARAQRRQLRLQGLPEALGAPILARRPRPAREDDDRDRWRTGGAAHLSGGGAEVEQLLRHGAARLGDRHQVVDRRTQLRGELLGRGRDGQPGEPPAPTGRDVDPERGAVTLDLAGVGGIDQHQPGGERRIPAGEELRHQSTERMSDENVRALEAGTLEQGAQLGGDSPRRAGARTGRAPAIAGPVIGADAHPRGQRPLHGGPGERGLADSPFEDDGRAAGATAQQVHAVAAQIDQLPGRDAPRPGLHLGAGAGDGQGGEP